jgi:hypothetical protein
MSFLHHLFLPHESNNQRAKLLHPSAISLIISFLVIIQLLLSQASNHYPQLLGYASHISPADVIRLTNVERMSHGLSPLQEHSQLDLAAAHKASDMFARDYWAHVSPVGTQPWFFITDAGYSYRYAGENLARDFQDAPSVIKGWMDSPSHRDNLLNARYQDIGVAVVDGKLGGRETTLVVQMLGARLNAAPSVSNNASFTVKAAESGSTPSPVPSVSPTPVPQVSVNLSTPADITPFHITRYISLGVLIVFAVVLFIDVVIVNRRKLVRWTSKSFAHFLFIAILIIAFAAVFRGQIL